MAIKCFRESRREDKAEHEREEINKTILKRDTLTLASCVKRVAVSDSRQKCTTTDGQKKKTKKIQTTTCPKRNFGIKWIFI